MRWRKLKVVPAMAANTCMCGAKLAETEEAARVERAAKRLVDEVKVSGSLHCCTFCALSCLVIICLFCRTR